MECRRLQRTRVAQPARVLAEQAGIRHDCIVENLSTLGACIRFDTTTAAELPNYLPVSTLLSIIGALIGTAT
jgi:hypothetical protein